MRAEDADSVAQLQSKVQNFCDGLSEYCDTVQVFCTTRSVRGDLTFAVNAGVGNFYAIRGQVAEWLMAQDQNAGNNLAESDTEDDSDDSEACE